MESCSNVNIIALNTSLAIVNVDKFATGKVKVGERCNSVTTF